MIAPLYKSDIDISNCSRNNNSAVRVRCNPCSCRAGISSQRRLGGVGLITWWI